VQTTGNAGALEGLVSGVSLADGHETRHLNLSNFDLTATESGQRLKGVSSRRRSEER
jgi:hypothetical protein